MVRENCSFRSAVGLFSGIVIPMALCSKVGVTGFASALLFAGDSRSQTSRRVV
jgi:hypothetical protein